MGYEAYPGEPFMADLGEIKDAELQDAVSDFVYRNWWDRKSACAFVQDLAQSRASASLVDTVVGYGACIGRESAIWVPRPDAQTIHINACMKKHIRFAEVCGKRRNS